MTDPNLYITIATAALAGLAMLTFAALTGWRGWLQLKAQQLQASGDIGMDRTVPHNVPNASARIEIADLKERIRKLEAIAAGVDLQPPFSVTPDLFRGSLLSTITDRLVRAPVDPGTSSG